MRILLSLVLSAVFTASSAYAGGFSRGTADTDILFEPGDFNFRGGATIVVPSQKFRAPPAAAALPALIGTNYLDTYVVPSYAIKFGLHENFSCAGTFTNSHGADSSYVVPYGAGGKIKEDLLTSEFGATCAAFFDVGPGRFALLGGAFVELLDYELLAANGALRIELDGRDYGWRAGVAYEIPDIAFRTQLLYRSGTSYGATGTATIMPGTILDAFGTGELPQSLELKVQSGIAPRWLAFGSVKWMNWSINETLDVGVPFAGPPFNEISNEYFWRDGWTVTAGIGHAFNEKLSGLVSLQWDRGVSTGYDLRSDKWLLAGGASFKDDRGGELRLGAGISYLSSAEITSGDYVGTSVESGLAGIFSAAYFVAW